MIITDTAPTKRSSETRGAQGLKVTVIGLSTAVLAACTTPAPPPPPPPPPPPVEVIPARPTPPGGASLNMSVPPMGIDGRRVTVNTGISATQQLWNMRSGLNVAALNCRSTRHIGLVENYGAFLKTHERELASANTALTREYSAKHGRREGRNIQDSYQTKVYNYFALPPALPAFCDEALAVSRDLVAVPRGELAGFVSTGLPRMEGVFGRFYNSYEQYRADVAAWDAKYAPAPTQPVTSTSGPTFVSQPVAQPVGPSDNEGG